jgi:hypothetical protein
MHGMLLLNMRSCSAAAWLTCHLPVAIVAFAYCSYALSLWPTTSALRASSSRILSSMVKGHDTGTCLFGGRTSGLKVIAGQSV